MRNAIATMLLLSAAPLLAQDQPGEAWLELPEVWPEVGQAYVVNLHLNTGAQEPDTLQMHLNFDPAVLQLAFSAATGFPPVFTNPDLALGGSLTA
ncbi:MAG: hypothetical protein HYZ00_04465, partial [Candidatus Hydrogenedentes bacterium]|nr:hypothetical protein [Candidatus Hydrogenedentota bacterium]